MPSQTKPPGVTLVTAQVTELSKTEKDEEPKSVAARADKLQQNHEAESFELESESEKLDQDLSAEEVGGWDFDELEKELEDADSAAKS